MILKFAFGVFCLGSPLVEGNIDFTALFTHVIGCLLQDAIYQWP